MTALSELLLRSNEITGGLPKEFSRLERLSRLDLQYNKLVGRAPGAWGALTRIRELNLGNNKLTGPMPGPWKAMSRLQILNLLNSGLDASLPEGMLGTLEGLASLQMGGAPQERTGPPIELDSLRLGLKVLVLDNAQLSATLPSALSALTKLEVLQLPNNPLAGTLPKELSAMTSLEVIDLHDKLGAGAAISGSLPVEWSALRRLTALSLGGVGSQCVVSGSLPHQWTALRSLTELSVPHCRLTGALPAAYEALTALETLDLSYNALEGILPPSFSALRGLKSLKLHANRLNGSLPVEYGALGGLEQLLLYINSLTGPLPEAYTGLQGMRRLSIRSNQFTGTLPESWMGLPQLEKFAVSANRLTGPIPDNIGDMNPCGLKALWLGSQGLTGTIPPSISKLTRMEMLHLNNAQLTGTVPAGISAMADHLSDIALSSNSLTGTFPASYCALRRLKKIRIDGNLFTGPLEACEQGPGALDPRSISICSPNIEDQLCFSCDPEVPGLYLKNPKCACTASENQNAFCGQPGATFVNKELLGPRTLDLSCFTDVPCPGDEEALAQTRGDIYAQEGDSSAPFNSALVYGLVGVLVAVSAIFGGIAVYILVKRRLAQQRSPDDDIETRKANGSSDGSLEAAASEGSSRRDKDLIAADGAEEDSPVGASVIVDMDESASMLSSSQCAVDLREHILELATSKGLGVISSMHKPQGEQVKVLELLACGGNGRVYRATWRGAVVAQKVMTLATETISIEKRKKREHMLAMEAAISASMCHPNVVQTYSYEMVPVFGNSNSTSPQSNVPAPLLMEPIASSDVVLSPRETQSSSGGGNGNGNQQQEVVLWEARIIQEFCTAGSLSSALKKGRLEGQMGPGQVPDAEAALSLAKGIAAGMHHIHTMKIVHGDLKAGNVLLQKSHQGLVAKVADFGLSAKLDDDQTHISEVRSGTISHMAPELLQSHVSSPAADVYAFGILLYELFSGTKAWRGMSGPAIMSAVVMHYKRPTFNPMTPLQIVELSTRCWAHNPEARPTFSGVLDSLGHIESLMKQGLLHRRMPRRVTMDSPGAVEKSSMSAAALPTPGSRLASIVGDSDREMNLIDPEDWAAMYIANLQRQGSGARPATAASDG